MYSIKNVIMINKQMLIVGVVIVMELKFNQILYVIIIHKFLYVILIQHQIVYAIMNRQIQLKEYVIKMYFIVTVLMVKLQQHVIVMDIEMFNLEVVNQINFRIIVMD